MYLASGRPHYEVASHNVSLFKAMYDSNVNWPSLADGMGQSNEPWW